MSQNQGRLFVFETVLPIFRRDTEGQIGPFVGTGFFIDDPPVLITADHVVRDWDGDFVVITPDFPVRWNISAFPGAIYSRDPDHDLAALEVPRHQPEFRFRLADPSSIANNIPVMCYEYGTTTTINDVANLSPASRMGNVTRVIDLSDRFGPAGERALELSFPALRGASGAPVVSSTDLAVWGVLVANSEYHLLPAQIESILDEENQLYEETRYMLPQAVAVNVMHVHQMLSNRSQ